MLQYFLVVVILLVFAVDSTKCDCAGQFGFNFCSWLWG